MVDLAKGMGQAVAERTILRKKENGEWETWADVAKRVAEGNAFIIDGDGSAVYEKETGEALIAASQILMSGRHLQHGDSKQRKSRIELFTNCSTAALSSTRFYLQLNGSGVGRGYDEDLLPVNWDLAPHLTCSLTHKHQDYEEYANSPGFEYSTKIYNDTTIMHVEDSREGWAQAFAQYEAMTYLNKARSVHKHLHLVWDNVRPRNSMIKGMQNRPSSGPVPTLNAFLKCAKVAQSSYDNWEKTLRIDQALSECVAVGGVRRAAAMATMHWKNPYILDFVKVKQFGDLWGANHSVMTDQEFWRQECELSKAVFETAAYYAYHGGPEGKGKGEPGFINCDMLEGA